VPTEDNILSLDKYMPGIELGDIDQPRISASILLQITAILP
jgi:hypothetical protein